MEIFSKFELGVVAGSDALLGPQLFTMTFPREAICRSLDHGGRLEETAMKGQASLT